MKYTRAEQYLVQTAGGSKRHKQSRRKELEETFVDKADVLRIKIPSEMDLTATCAVL